VAWELLLFFGAPLLWGVWQLISLRRDRRAAERRDSPPPSPPPPPPPPPAPG
jgi:hypothetical protein